MIGILHQTDGGRQPRDPLALHAPDTSQNTDRIAVRATGATPGDAVELEATTTAEDGVEWRSHATFTADGDGVVDLTDHAPDDGTYRGVEPMGWLWSMHPDDEDVNFPALGGPAFDVELTATSGDQTASHTITRVRWDADVTARDADADRVTGTLYEPPSDGPHPAVIDLHGSAGRMSDTTARRLATEGYATLALHYFGDPDGVPDTLERIPLSSVDAAADWLRDQPTVAGDRVGLHGASRGAELALLLAARRDWVGCVVSYAGSVPWDTPSGAPAWLDDGDPVPHITADEAPRFEDLDEKPVDSVVPAIETANGPVLLLSGGSDPVWQSRRLSQAIADRLRDRAFDHQFAHHTYDDVGHFIGRPYLPLGGLGDPDRQRATAHAGEDSWPRVLDYLETGLREE